MTPVLRVHMTPVLRVHMTPVLRVHMTPVPAPCVHYGTVLGAKQSLMEALVIPYQYLWADACSDIQIAST